MPPYNQIHWEYVLYILLGGSLLSVLIWLAVRSREVTFTFRRKTEKEYEDEIHEFGGGVREGHRPVPVFLVVMLALLVVWAIGYTIYSGSNFPH